MSVLAQRFGIPEEPAWTFRYNIAPTQAVAAIRLCEPSDVALADDRGLAWLRWGLVPFWADDPKIGSGMINARSETVHEKPAFRAAFKKRRCLVLADGYYEWKAGEPISGSKKAPAKRPFHIRRPDQMPMAFAGLWERWTKGSEPLETCTILTTSGNSDTAAVHDRMPVILSKEEQQRWLDLDAAESQLRELLRPAEPGSLELVEVSTRVNRPMIDDASLLDPIAAS